MNFILLIACVSMILGFFVVFEVDFLEFSNSIFDRLIKKPDSLKHHLDEATKRKKVSFFKREVTEIYDILKMTGRQKKFPFVCTISVLMFCIGSLVAIMVGNVFLIPVLAVGFMFVPFWYIKLTQTYFKKNISSELETALSIITTSYLRNENIIISVEENVEYLNNPVKNVFSEFLYRVKMVNPDVVLAVQNMKIKIENPVFKEWCDNIIQCQYDKNLKATLVPSISKLSDMRIVNAELETLVIEPRKEFVVMQMLVILNIPLVYFLNKEWYHTLMHTVIGKIVLAVCFVIMFIGIAKVIKLTKPIEYRR